MFGQFASTTQFYLYGRSWCTRTGWEKMSANYPKPDILTNEDLDLSDKVFMVTGANAGIGGEIAKFLASKGATLYMVCRNPERGQKARDDLVEVSKNEKVHLLLGDCGLERDVRRIWEEFTVSQQKVGEVKLDALVCNAGALLNEKTLTDEGVEVTFATHLLFGTYLLGKLALPTLEATPDSRLVVVSSGGMYNGKFPRWDRATWTGDKKYDGQFAYVYAKRGQVLLCEEWAKQYSGKVKVVSCHPGWTMTGGVQSAYGDSKKYLEPLRTLWQGSEGILWLCIAPPVQIKDGEFYLDRCPQRKHLAGPFFTEGTFTKNTPKEVEVMMQKLEQWSSSETRPNLEDSQAEAARYVPLKATTTAPLDIPRYMGNWYVLANIPTSYEVGKTNCIERYSYDEENNRVRITFDYQSPPKNNEQKGKPSQMNMRGRILNSPTSTHWAIDPKIYGIRVPIGLDYLTIDFDNETAQPTQYQYSMIGVPTRANIWIMIRDLPSDFSDTAVSVFDAYPELRQEFSEYINPEQVADSNTTASSEQREKELSVLRRALRRAVYLGYDVSKVERVPWSSALHAEGDTATSNSADNTTG